MPAPTDGLLRPNHSRPSSELEDAFDAAGLVAFFKEAGFKMVTAESCTAGLIASTVADVPGAGGLLDCAFVTYSPEAKQRCLGVQASTLEKFNLTSETVAREMAIGALNNSRANLAVSNTGVTDPVDDEVAPGTQCYAWIFVGKGGRRTVYSETRVFEGDRSEIRLASARYALSRIRELFNQTCKDVISTRGSGPNDPSA
ncbi:CinA family protein [Piscinibacter gummiphilus]|nr:CinA family protein [Piscinibacter gummiphilus]GLS95557.1 hypothetical protein GCM10007918_28490 [Piscinibacter gummiphilus]